jgi:hypothetical protein
VRQEQCISRVPIRTPPPPPFPLFITSSFPSSCPDILFCLTLNNNKQSIDSSQHNTGMFPAS